MFNQQRFLGATTTGFSASVGWGESPSQLVVNLVEDDAIGDVFTPPNVGFPVTFQFNTFTFTGILQSYDANADTGSGYTFSATITDPRDYLEGTQLILDGYTGGVNTYNLLNVYGYLESFGFGASEKNESGIKWTYIRDAIHAMTRATQQGTYGGPLYFLSSRYIVDLTSLPQVPEDYRVGGDSISVLSFISEICEAGGCDYFITMIEASTGIFVIKVNTVSRTGLINYGVVTEFLASISQYENKSVGRELSNEVTSKFVTGGLVRELWYQYGDYSFATIWPFWGYDINNEPVIGVGLGNNHTFTLDSRSVNNPRVGAFYQSDVAEIRAVLGGRAGWETFLILRSGDGSIHSNKAAALSISGYIANKTAADLFNEIFTSYDNSSTDPTKKKVELDITKTLFPHIPVDYYDQLDKETGYLYDFLYQIATEYYGKKFMVNIPYTYSAVEPDTLKIRVSQLPVESAYLSEPLWPIAIQNNLVPLDVDRFSEEDGKLICYVRFDQGDFLDLSDLSPDSIAYNSNFPGQGQHKLQNYAVFVKATVEEKVVYLDSTTQFGPRAIITLDGVVHERVYTDDFSSKQILIDFINGGFSNRGINVTSSDYKKNVLDKILGHIAQDVLNYGTQSTAVIPNMAVIPLESQVLRYGPWYSNGAPGKVDFETDDTLVPWNYGGYQALNLAGYAKTTLSIGQNQQLEQGSVTFPDIPFHSLGEPLLFGGPIVSDISVSIDSGGAHTTYKFRRNIKQPRYGQAKAARVAQLARTGQQLRRAVRIAQSSKTHPDVSLTKKPIIVDTKAEHPKVKKTSSHEVLVGQIYTDSNGKTNTSVFLQSEYNFTSHNRKDYANKAFMSLDGLLTPYSTLDYGAFNSFVTPKSGANSPTVDDLSPFPSITNSPSGSLFTGASGLYPAIKLIAADQSLPSSLFNSSPTGDYRGIALRTPMILSGFGVSSSGTSVGNRVDARSWRTGPLDVRWDHDRGVWSAGADGGGLIRGTMKSSTTAHLINANTDITAINWLGSNIGSGDNVFLMRETDGLYYIVNQTYYSVGSVISSIGCNANGTANNCSTSFKIPSRIGQSGPSGCPQTTLP